MYFLCFEKEKEMLEIHTFNSGMVAWRNHAHSPKSKVAQQTKKKKKKLLLWFASYHFLVWRESDCYPTICVSAQLKFHIGPYHPIAEEIVAGLRVTARLAVSIG